MSARPTVSHLMHVAPMFWWVSCHCAYALMRAAHMIFWGPSLLSQVGFYYKTANWWILGRVCSGLKDVELTLLQKLFSVFWCAPCQVSPGACHAYGPIFIWWMLCLQSCKCALQLLPSDVSCISGPDASLAYVRIAPTSSDACCAYVLWWISWPAYRPLMSIGKSKI